MQCYKIAKLQHLSVAEYYTSPFAAEFIRMLLYSSAFYPIAAFM